MPQNISPTSVNYLALNKLNERFVISRRTLGQVLFMWINGDLEVFDILDAATDAELALVQPYLEMPRKKLLEAYRRLNSGETRPYKFGRRVQAPQSPGAAISVKELEHMPVLDLMPSGSDYGFVNRTMLLSAVYLQRGRQ